MNRTFELACLLIYDISNLKRGEYLFFFVVKIESLSSVKTESSGFNPPNGEIAKECEQIKYTKIPKHSIKNN